MISQQPTADTTDVRWILDSLVDELPKIIVHALLFTTDGLVLAHSRALQRNDADRAAAAMAGMKSLHTELAVFCGASAEEGAPTPLRYVISDMKTATMLLFAVGPRTGIGVAVQGESMSQQVNAAITATLKTIAALRPVLDARERSDPA